MATHCESCGAPLPRNTTLCSYCGTRNMVDVQGLGNYAALAPAEKRLCPGCGTTMETIDISHTLARTEKPFLIEKCPSCQGLFFDPDELQYILEEKTLKIRFINHERLKDLSTMRIQDEVVYRPCPVCKNLMNRVNFGAKSGVVVDRCRDHGIYLDAGELRQLLEWRRAGGHIAEQLSAKSKEKERLQRENEQKQALARLQRTGGEFDPKMAWDGQEEKAIDVLVGLFKKWF